MNKHIVILFVLIGFMLSCSDNTEHDNHKEHKSKTYTCPMHPQITKNEPGQCPICGMKLVEKENDGHSTNDSIISLLLKPTNEYVFSRVKTTSLHQKEFPVEITATGTIKYDTREVNTVSARVSGWIEKLYIKYQFQPVSKGERLMDIYSKELLTAQENFLFLLKNDAENETLINAAEKRLFLQGLSKEQIDKLKRAQKVFHAVSIFSPYSGHLHDLNGTTIASPDEVSGMNNGERSTAELIIKEGMYIRAGQSIFNIYNTEKVWAALDIYSENIQLLKTGQRVILFMNGSKEDTLEGKIDFIEPAFNKGRKTASARVYLDNSKHKLKIGLLLKANVYVGAKKGFFIPSTAIVHLGNAEIVFLREKDILKSKVITTGIKAGEFTEVISGISESDKIAANAQMLIDSESFIRLNPEE
ncbi:MAG: efflux RND transporter periplasmic adaptor subunit [Bacteroidetes bacterium]|nr:efflux RND transporter periplasmic adaptor subunit [Bacteroidota bacterium]